ncbi:zinc finger protein 862-like [Liolophura sinensis]|uniref:zinc finger protein 862-like n=1 Tax=Liolophura sinensis TaxID=3198878 RepID=UPI0031592E76
MSKRKCTGTSNSESVSLKTFLSWDCNQDFDYETDDTNKLTKLQCKVCSQHLARIRGQAKLRGITGQSLQSLINYVDGVTYIHKSNVTRHVRSGSLHDWAKKTFDNQQTRAENASTTTTTTTTSASPCTSSAQHTPPASVLQSMLLKGSREQYKHHFFTVLAIVLKERPMSDLKDLIELQKKNGVTFVSGKCNKVACREMVSYLAQALRDDVQNILQNCSFFACEQDGSEARKTREEKELIYVKVVIRGEPLELLLKCQKMTDFGGVSAANLKRAIDDAFQSYNVSGDKYQKGLVSACADGAAVNLGRLNGAMTVLKAERPWMLIIHCSAHPLELAVQDAFKQTPDFQRIDDMMLNLHLFFRDGEKRWRILILVTEKLGVLIQRFPKDAGTRFQVHKYRALKVLIVNFLPLCLFAENMIQSTNKECDPPQKAKLRGYLNQWLSYQYLASLHMYRLVLHETAHLSYICQESQKLVTEVIVVMKSAEDNLAAVAENNEELPFPAEINDDSVTITASATNLPANQNFKEKNQLTEKQKTKAQRCTSVTRECFTVKKVAQGREAVKRIKQELIPGIVSHITNRMKSFDEEIFSAFKIADHSLWDYSNADYGVAEIKAISSHFEDSLKSHGFSIDLALFEWRALKKVVRDKYQHFTNKVAMWKQLFIHYQVQFPHILLIIELVLVTPYSSASVERGFSLMSRLLSNTRLILSNKTLDDLMALRINSLVLLS